MFKKIAFTLIVSVVGMNFVSCADNVVLTAQEEKTVATIEKNIEKVQISKEEQASVRKFIAKHKAAVIAITSLVALATTGTSLYFLKPYVQDIPGLAWMSKEVVYIVDGACNIVKNYGGSAVYSFGENQVAVAKEHWIRTSVIAATTIAVAGIAIYYYATKISKKADKKQNTTSVVIAVPKPA